MPKIRSDRQPLAFAAGSDSLSEETWFIADITELVAV
jgi:hypothetical protein